MALNNSSLSFNGIDQYAKFGVHGSIRNLSSFAFSCWFKVGDKSTKTTQHAYVERQGTGSKIRFRFTPVAGKLQFGFSAKDGVSETAYTYNTKWDDRWHHTVFTARLGERSTYEIMLDGVVVMSGTLIVPNEVTKVSNTASLGIWAGNYSVNSSTPSEKTAWHGLIDDIAIHSQGLAQGTVNTYITSLKRWDEQHDPDEGEELDTNLIVYYPFDENTGTTSTDRGSTEVDNPEPNQDGTIPDTHMYHGPAQTATFYKGSSTSSTLWTIDRPYLGNGLRDTVIPSTPGSPTTVSGSITADEFVATWTGSTDNVWVQFYEMQVSEYADFSTYMSFDTGRVLTKKVTGLLPATNYYWRVRAFDAELNPSNYSTVRSLTTLTSGDVMPPNPPTHLGYSYVTHSSFRVTFTHSTSADAVGYKLDVSPKADFSEFVRDYRNKDIGNVTFEDVVGVEPLSSYYVRMRTYDAYDNESNDSTVIRVNTTRQPDITPPLPAVMLDATTVSATSAVLNWEEGIDDTGVVGYYLDISETATFADYLLTETMYWESVDVGNVTSYRVEGLTPNTPYFYRVRAYDEAGNVAGNVDGIQFITSVHSLFEGGLLESEEYQLTWRENDVTEVATPRVGDTTTLFIEYDLSNVVGTLQSVTLRLMPRQFVVPVTYGTIGIRASLGDITTTPTGDEIEVSITQVDEFLEVDITPLITQTSKYCVQIRSIDFTGYIDMGQEVADFNENNPSPPALVVITDPLSSTQPARTDIRVSSHYRENLVENPSFETSLVGWTTLGSGVTLAQEQGGVDGDYYMAVEGSLKFTGAVQGTHFAEIGPNRPVAATVDLYSLLGSSEYRVTLHAYNDLGALLSDITSMDVRVIPGKSRRVSLSGMTPENTERVRLSVSNLGDTDYKFAIDNVTVTNSLAIGSPFTGNSSRSRWVGVANESVSRVASPTIAVISPYIGDSNNNNSVDVSFRNASDLESWIPIETSITTDRVLKQHRFTVGPSYGQYNRVVNPSFEISDYGWSGGLRIEDSGYVGNAGYRVEQAPYEGVYELHLDVTPGETYSAQAQVLPDEEMNAHLTIFFYDETETIVGMVPSDYAYGDGMTWTLLTATAEAPEDASYARVFVAGTGPFMMDAVQFSHGGQKPYRDGDTLDGAWEGTPHRSMTGLQLLPETTYDIRIEYSDPEGFFDTDSTQNLVVVDRFTTPEAPDDVFNAEPFKLTANENTIFVVLPYTGDDNENSTVRMEFRRTDLTTWSELRPIFDRNRKEITTTIPNVRHGTNYTVRAIIADPDGVYGAVNNVVTGAVTTSYITAEGDSSPLISFGGFVLMGREDTKVGVTGHDAFGFPDRRVNVEVLPRLDGAVEMQALWGRKIIRMSGFISGDSRADLDEVQGALKRGLAPRQQRLVIDTLSRRGRYYNATCERLDMEESAEVNLRHLRWEAEFVCADPFAYDISESVVPTFTAPHNGTISVVNSGDAQVSPTFQITTTSAYPVNVLIINTSTGERIAPKSTIISGNRLIIDTERKSLTKNGVEIDYSGSFPRLAVGGNEFRFELSIARTATSSSTVNTKVPPPTINVDLRWRHKYL